MTYFTEAESEACVIDRMADCRDARLKTVMAAAVRHLHAFLKEVEPTQEEWFQAIQFLTATGQICDDRRQEWILLSDTLGASMLVDAINNRKPQGATESTVLGPFHVSGAPVEPLGANIARDEKGAPCIVSGRVTDAQGRPIAGAELDVWQASDDGFYDVQQPGEQPEMNLRGRFRTDADGRYHFRTIKPCSYPIPDDGPVGKLLRATGRHPYRPAHIHFIVTAPGMAPLTTHIFCDDDPYLDSDAVFGVKESLIYAFPLVEDAAERARWGMDQPFHHVVFDVRLTPAG